MEDLLAAELTIDIISRLPVKTIIYCKCVCKKWRNLVMESSFVDLHLSRSPTGLIIHYKPPIPLGSNVSNNPRILMDLNDPGILGWVEIEDKDDYHHLHHDPLMSLRLNLAPILHKSLISLMGSVNGLICIRQYHSYFDSIYICNPVTREYMILPIQKFFRRGGQAAVIYGFGMSSTTGEYKVIQAFQSHNYQPRVSEAEVYTLGTGQWRSLGPVPYDFDGPYDGSFLNDHCHWIVSDEEYPPEKLGTFDFNKETFQLFPSPPIEAIVGSRYNLHRLAILNGYLCKMDSYDYQITIWVMKEYGIKESWHKEVVINQAISPHLDWPLFQSLYLIEGLKDGSILTLYRSKLWPFYPNNKTIEDTGLFEFSSYFVSGMAYRPSFLKLQNFELEKVHMF